VVVIPIVFAATLAVLVTVTRSHRTDIYQVPPPGLAVHATVTPSPRAGVFEPGTPESFTPVVRFAAASGVHPGIVLYYSGWWQPFARKFAEQTRAAGALPMIQMIPYGRGVSMRQVVAGQYDGYLRTFAEQVRRYGHPVIIGFAPEPNGRWYNWGWTHLQPSVWIAAWRHVVNAFRQQGAHNVTWLWTINRTVNRTGLIHDWWPGKQYVTWVGIDGYYVLPSSTFASTFTATLQTVKQLTTDPVLISETAVGRPYGGDVQAKITDLFAGVRQYHLAGVVWFDACQHDGIAHQCWRLEGHPGALAAFLRGVTGMLPAPYALAAGEGTARSLR
jgi:hypothetical protein